MSKPDWASPRDALQMASTFLDATVSDAAAWLVTDLHSGRRQARADLAVVYDTDPPRELKGKKVPTHLWDNPRPSAWVAELAPEMPFGRQFWIIGNRDFYRNGDLAVRLIGVTIDVTGIRTELASEGEGVEPDPPPEESEEPAPLSPLVSISGRPSKRGPALEIYARRLLASEVKQDKSAEAYAIEKAWGGATPARQATIAKDYIKPFHKLCRFEGGELKNGPEVAETVIAAIRDLDKSGGFKG